MPVTITTTPVVNIIGRTANHFGVGEVVDLHSAIVPAPVMTPAWRWDVTMGRDLGNFSYNGGHARVIFLGLAGGTMTIRARNALDNAEATIDLTIEAPKKWSIGPIQYRFHLPNCAHAAFRAAVQVENLHNVSFDNIEMREGNAMPQRMGRYILDNINLNNHHQATFGLHANWINLGNSRLNAPLQAAASPRHLAIAIDRVGSYSFGPRNPPLIGPMDLSPGTYLGHTACLFQLHSDRCSWKSDTGSYSRFPTCGSCDFP